MDSIWQEGKLPRFRMLDGEVSADVLVIGGGIAGLLCAHHLQQAGVECIVAEAADPGGGITKGTTAKITAQHGLCYHKLLSRFGTEKARMYLEANQKAVDAYRVMCREIDCDFVDADNFIYSRSDREVLDRELAALDVLGFPAELAEQLPLPFPTVGAVKFSRQAQFHPLKFLSDIAKELQVYDYTPVRQLVGNTAVTDHGRIRAEHIVVATHFPFLNKHGSYFLKLYQQRSYALALENAPLFPGMYLDAQENGLSFRTHGEALILGGGGHRTGKGGGNWKELEDFVREQYPQAKITHRWAAQDCMTLDGLPYIGQYSARTAKLYVATGFNKWGMTNAMVAAQLLTDLILGRENPYAPVFSPSRSILRPQLAVNAFETAVSLLSPSPKRCPHLGCALKWNPQEHSWDCPCHGSRFTEDGRLIDNPATGDLKQK